MTVIRYGDELIAGDVKRLLKKYKNITSDLNCSFDNFQNKYLLYHNTSDDSVYFDELGIKGYEMKIAIKSHGLSKQHGCRLWYLLVPSEKDVIYLPALLFDCREEAAFPKRVCLEYIKRRLEIFKNS